MELWSQDEFNKVQRAFYEDGRLKALPVKMKKRLYVLDAFVRGFEIGKDYPEQEVNTIITRVFEDYCTIRRELVEFGFMERDSRAYRRLRPDGWLPSQ